MFLYGRGTENRTLIYGLKARYFTIKLYPQGSLVTVHRDSPLKYLGAPRWIRTIVSALPWQRVTIAHYGSLAEGIGIEPIITESKSVVIPFN